MIPATQLKVGMVILYENELYRVSELMHVTPGKGRGMMQVKLYHLKTETYYEKRFRSDKSMEVVHVNRQEMEFLYQADTAYTFMDTKTYDQVDIPAAILGDADLQAIETQACLQVRAHVYGRLFDSLALGVLGRERPARGAAGELLDKSTRVEVACQQRLGRHTLHSSLGRDGNTAQIGGRANVIRLDASLVK